MKSFYKWILLLVLSAITFACTENKNPKVIKVALDEQNPSTNCYTAILPENESIRLYMLLIPGFGERVDDVLNATNLPFDAARAGIAVFIPTLQDGVESYSFSFESQSNLQNIIDDICVRFDLSESDYCIGGFVPYRK